MIVLNVCATDCVCLFSPLLARLANKKDMSPHRRGAKKQKLDTVKKAIWSEAATFSVIMCLIHR